MEDQAKTIEQLIGELAELREEVDHLKALEGKHRQAEEALRESEVRFRTLADFTYDWESWIGPDGAFTYVSPSCERITGYPASAFMEDRDLFIEITHPDDREMIFRHLEEELKGAEVASLDFRIITRDGEERWISHCCQPAFTEKGRPIGRRASNRDITGRKEAEEALRRSEERYRRIALAVTDYIFSVRIENGEPTQTFHGPASVHVTGYAPEDYAADPYLWLRMVHEDDRDAILEQARAVLSGKDAPPVEHRICRKDGVIRWVRNTLVPHYASEGRLVSYDGLIRDITERKLAEEALKKSEALLRNTFEAIPDLLTVHDRDLRIVLSSWHGHEFVPVEARDKRPHCYWAYMHRDTPCDPCHALEVFRTGKPKTVEFFNPDPRVGFLEINAYPVFDDSGNVVLVTEYVRNINERKRAQEETERLQAQLQRAQKMEAIGTLAGGIAHDFNNLLMAIQGNCSLMLLGMDASHPCYERLKRTEEQVQIGARLAKQLLGYARKGKYEIKPIGVNQLVEETSAAFGAASKGIEVHRDLEKDLVDIEIDQGQMEQVLLNLFVNAADAMPHGGHLFLRTRNTTQEEMKGLGYDAPPGKYVLLTVTDTGIGMDEATQKRIFEPFFTTKEMGRGTGLGLASVYGIIKAYGGYIDVESEKEVGTTFRIHLPASSRKAPRTVRAAQRLIKGSGTILLVDDEELIREVGRELLAAMGYKVLTAGDGEEAVEVFEKKWGEIDLVLLDMIMPRLAGGAAFDRMREIDKDVKVLLSSGYTIDGEAGAILSRGCRGFIQKPFNLSELSRRIKDIIEDRSAETPGQ